MNTMNTMNTTNAPETAEMQILTRHPCGKPMPYPSGWSGGQVWNCPECGGNWVEGEEQRHETVTEWITLVALITLASILQGAK